MGSAHRLPRYLTEELGENMPWRGGREERKEKGEEKEKERGEEEENFK
jgi:hypothetical protein